MSTLDDWRSLLTDVEKATGPSGILDERVGMLIGWQPVGGTDQWTSPYDSSVRAGLPCVTASVDAITALIEREMPDASVTMRWGRDDGGDRWCFAVLDHRDWRDEAVADRQDHEKALTLTAAYARASIAELEQSEAAA